MLLKSRRETAGKKTTFELNKYRLVAHVQCRMPSNITFMGRILGKTTRSRTWSGEFKAQLMGGAYRVRDLHISQSNGMDTSSYNKERKQGCRCSRRVKKEEGQTEQGGWVLLSDRTSQHGRGEFRCVTIQLGELRMSGIKAATPVKSRGTWNAFITIFSADGQICWLDNSFPTPARYDLHWRSLVA